MEIKVISLGHIAVNCYMISTDKAAIVIDPGFSSAVVENFLLENADKERLILLTHGHFDHIGGAADLRDVTDTDIAIGEKENFALSDMEYNLSDRFHAHLEPFSADILLKDGEEFLVGDIKLKTILTPGHTVGGVSYLIDDILFSGDTLFNLSIGRTDFPGGDGNVLLNSLKRLKYLDGDFKVYPGHGNPTTLSNEKVFNPYMRNL